MNFDAVQNSVNEILSIKRKYLIPRNQREFSWEKTQLDEFWTDILRNIEYKDEKFIFNEYFLGTVVFAGGDSSSTHEIIDGQQRLTVITITLSLISRALRRLGYDEYADDIFKTYIITSISDGLNLARLNSKTEKIAKTNDNDFFKLKFQDVIDHEPAEKYEEDTKLTYAGKYITRKLNKSSVCGLLKKSKCGVRYSKEDYAGCLLAIQEMITNYIKVVKIAVGSQEDAYDIFEILNARGINLTSIDLIKNKMLQYCTELYPIDKAKQRWLGIDEKLKSRETNLSFKDYVRTWWLSNYEYVGQEQLYRAFKKKIYPLKPEIKDEEYVKEQTHNILERLYSDVEYYIFICNPQESDWKQSDQKIIYTYLNALSIFDITVPRPLIFSMLRKRKALPRSFKQTDLINLLSNIVKFHFRFNAICKSRHSGQDQKYSTWAISLDKAKDRREIRTVINDIELFFTKKMPPQHEFVKSFKNLWYCNEKTSQKKLITYIFEQIEIKKRGTNELRHDSISIEHISSQSKHNGKKVGSIGNLLPLGFKINETCSNKPLASKIKEYERSDLILVKDFLSKYRHHTWNDDVIDQRSGELAKLAYDLM